MRRFLCWKSTDLSPLACVAKNCFDSVSENSLLSVDAHRPRLISEHVTFSGGAIFGVISMLDFSQILSSLACRIRSGSRLRCPGYDAVSSVVW